MRDCTHTHSPDAYHVLGSQSAAYICKHGSAPAIVRKGVAATPSLLIHRIPEFCTVEMLRQMIINNTQVVPAEILPITRGADAASPPVSTGSAAVPIGKTTVTFSTQQHADLAFDTIPGPNKPDKSNRAQKRVYLRGGGYICIRK